MEPRIAEANGNKAPVLVWGNDDTPSTPPPEYYMTAQTSPVVLTKSESKDTVNTYPNSPKSISSNNNELNGVIPYSDGVKFVDADGKIIHIDREDSICSSGSSIDDDDVPKKLEVPDGGWGWVVVVASLGVSMVADGISFSFGLMFIEFLKAFGQSKAKTAWIGSLFMAVPLLSGPVMSAFVDRYGCRLMTMVGGIISGIGFVLAVFGNSVEYEYATFGVIAGFGLGLCYVTAVVSVCQWFEKHRALATGLGACGTGFGTTVYAPMTQYFIEEYGWRGTVLLLAGTFLNMCVFGALMRDPPYLIEERKEKESTKSIRASSCGSVSGTESQFPGTDEIRAMMKSGKKPEDILSTLAETFRTTDEIDKINKEHFGEPRISHSVVDLPTHVRTVLPLEDILEDNPLKSCRSASDQGKLHKVESPERRALSIRRQKKRAVAIAASEDPYAPHMQPLMGSPLPTPLIVSGFNRPKPLMSILKRQFSFKQDPPQNYLKNMRVHRNSMMYRGATFTSGKYHLRASSCPNIFRNSMTTLAKEQEEKWYSEIVELGKTIFDFSMFLEFHFLLVSIAIILLFTFFIVPIFYLAEMMTRNGWTAEDGSVVLGNIGVITGLGMIFFGWVGDLPSVNVAKLFAGCMIMCGVSCIIMPLVVTQFWVITAVAWMFGLFFASSYSLTPPIIVELIPVERFTTAYGLILLCQGIGNLVGPPLAGFIFDLTGSWDVAFYLSGVGIIICGILIGMVPYTTNRRIYGSGMLEMDRISNA